MHEEFSKDNYAQHGFAWSMCLIQNTLDTSNISWINDMSYIDIGLMNELMNEWVKKLLTSSKTFPGQVASTW